MNIPIFDLIRQYKTIKKEIDAAIQKVLTKGNFILSDEVAFFEKEFARYIAVPYAVGVASGTDALTLALKAIDVRKGDEVILPANAYPSAFGVALSGATIRLADSLPDGTIDPVSIEKALSSHTKAIIPVHLYGNPAQIIHIQNIISIAEKRLKHKVYLIEDAAQAHGVEIELSSHNLVRGSKMVGGIGDIGCFSFYPSKNLGAYGDGGIITTHNADIATRVKKLRMYGEIDRYNSLEVSGISRLDELQAAVLRVKLKHLSVWNKRRSLLVKYYLESFHGLPFICLTQQSNNVTSAHHLFVIQTDKRDTLKEYLGKNGIITGIHYPVPVHLSKAFVSLGYKKGDFPIAEKQSNEVLSLPLFAELTDTEVKKVIKKVKQFFV